MFEIAYCYDSFLHYLSGIIFEHNWFEIPEVLDFAKLYDIQIVLKINTRPKFRIKDRLIPNVVDLYERNKFRLSTLVLAN